MKQAEKEYLKATIMAVVVLFVSLGIALLLSGCRTKYVTVPEYHTEYIVRTDTFVSRDSVCIHDSVTVEVRGDTVYLARWHTQWRDRWREKIVSDTVIRRDSVAVPYPVEKKLTRWQQIKIDFTEIIIICLVVGIIIVVVLARRRLP